MVEFILDQFKNLISGFNTLHDYAAATVVHWILMGVGAVLILRSHYKGGPVMRVIGTLLCALWVVYELSEFARIHDNVEKDIANGIFGFCAGAVLHTVYRAAHKRWGGRKFLHKIRTHSEDSHD